MDKQDYYYEALYQIWMRGGDPDRLSFDRAEQDYYNGNEPDYTAEMEIKRQRSIVQKQREYERQMEEQMYQNYIQQEQQKEKRNYPDAESKINDKTE